MKYLLLSLVAVLLSFGSAVPASSAPKDDPSEEIRRLFRDDQRDQDRWDTMTDEEFVARQRARRDRAFEIVRAGSLRKPEDYERAGWLFMHGRGVDDFLLAHVLGMAAAIEGVREARFLCAASLDRYLMSVDHKQVFGSQTSDASGATQPKHDPDGLARGIVHIFADNGVTWREPDDEDLEPKRIEDVAKELAKLAKAASRDAKHDLKKLSRKRVKKRTGRVARTLEIVRRGAVEDASALYDAALILRHGDTYSHHVIGHILAMAAGIRADPRAPLLCAGSLDRLLLTLGRSQVFGTLRRKDAGEKAPSFAPLHPRIRARFGLKKTRRH